MVEVGKLSQDELNSLFQDAVVPEGKSASLSNDTTAGASTNIKREGTSDNSLLLELEVDVIVELGRIERYIKDILTLNEGSILELNSPVNEPVNVIVNNRVIGRGEVVVSDEDFGIRLVELYKQSKEV